MKLTADDENKIRKYLLGDLSEEEQSRFEERLLSDDEYFDLLEVVEGELIDDYAMGALTEREREQFETYFLSTPERRRKLRFAMTFANYAAGHAREAGMEKSRAARKAPWWKLSLLPAYVKWAVAAVIVLGIGIGVWRIFFYEAGKLTEIDRGLAALKKAYSRERPLESRITGLDYAPFSVTRGNEQRNVDYAAHDLAARTLLNEDLNNPSSASHHSLGRFYLTNREFEKAIHQFQEALKTDQRNAELYSDLGAAYFERAVADRDKPNLSDLARSLEELNKAIEIDSSLLAAYFNKALCLQRMNALTSAKEAWEDYLKKDINSQWSKEAEKNLRSLEGQGINNRTPEEVFQDFLAAYRQQNEAQAWRIQSQTKEMITGTMIPFQLARRLTAAFLSNQTETGEEVLGAFIFAGELEKKHSGDPFFVELARYYSIDGKKNAAFLKQAQDALEQGYQLCLQGRYSDGNRLFEDAQNLFLRADNIWESKVVDYWLAYCLSQQGKLKRSSDLLLVLAKNCRSRHYHWLEAQSYCWLANNSALLGDYSQGVEQDKKALCIAAATGDLYSIQKTSSQLAEDYKFLGRPAEALEFNQVSLPSSDNYYASQWQLWRSLNSVTDTLFALHLYAAAEAYEQQALQLALNQFNSAALIHNSYMRLGQIYAGKNNYSAATQALELSLKTLQPIENDPMGKKLFGLSMLQIGNLKRQIGDYPAALEYYRQAAQRFDSSEFSLYNYSTHKGMLLCHLLNKDDHAIQQELPTVLSLFEQNRQRIKEELNRNHFFDTEQGVYESVIDYEHGRNNKEHSFHLAERSRARSLQDAMIGGAIASNDSMSSDVVVSAVSQPLTLAQLQERLPANLQLVEYAVLRNRLLVWIITKTRFEVVEQRISMSTLESVTNEYLEVLTRNDADSIEREKQLAAELHDWLFAPLESYLNKADEVALVPDKFLFKAPFAALLSRRSGQRIIEDYTLLYAPSATVVIICSDLARMKTHYKETERLLSVGDPLFNRQQYQGLPNLPAAAVEAEKIAAFYSSKVILIRSDALKKQIVPELRKSDVIHFATHYLPDDFSPAKSRLLLTARREIKTQEAADDLSLQEIQTMRLLKTKVAILSACQSGIERYYAGEGLIGLSRAFLAAGIPLVIASQWPVESDSTADLMIEFHKLRKVQNLSTIEALRQAQLTMLNHEDERYRRPYYWAAFFPFGGYASY